MTLSDVILQFTDWFVLWLAILAPVEETIGSSHRDFGAPSALIVTNARRIGSTMIGPITT